MSLAVGTGALYGFLVGFVVATILNCGGAPRI